MIERLLSSVVTKLAVTVVAFKFKLNSEKKVYVYCFDHCAFTEVYYSPMTELFPLMNIVYFQFCTHSQLSVRMPCRRSLNLFTM